MTRAHALLAASASLARHGVTAFLATTRRVARGRAAARIEALAAALDATRLARRSADRNPSRRSVDPTRGRGRAAARWHPPLRPGEGAAIFDRAGHVRCGSSRSPPSCPARAVSRPSSRAAASRSPSGHTLADAPILRASVANGACHVTHLFNAMGSTRHRDAADGTPMSEVARRVLRRGAPRLRRDRRRRPRPSRLVAPRGAREARRSSR